MAAGLSFSVASRKALRTLARKVCGNALGVVGRLPTTTGSPRRIRPVADSSLYSPREPRAISPEEQGISPVLASRKTEALNA
ncbi:MAG: hypothetical protein DME50_04935 [Verrucomicrobia bacterium]|nr:MAG: hypothetical protein DME50_04935 [Verrucomicrobiota bacterium]